MVTNDNKTAHAPIIQAPEGIKTKTLADVVGAGILKTEAVKGAFFVQSFAVRSVKDKTTGSRKPIWYLSCVNEDGEPFTMRLGCNEGRDAQFEAMQVECENGFAMGPFVLIKKDVGSLQPMWDLEDATYANVAMANADRAS